jgi:hypothetical protein
VPSSSRSGLAFVSLAALLPLLCATEQRAFTDAASCRVETSAALPNRLRESSGVTRSGSTAGLFWTHNDSEKRARVYGLDAAGEVRATVLVTGADVHDWEDIARGRCPEGTCLYVGDIGDNAADRDYVTVYRFPEPHPTASASAAAVRFDARYPDGPRDAEALFVLPSGRLYVVSKGERRAIGVYAFPENPAPAVVTELQLVRRLSAGPVDRQARVTGAAAAPDGRYVALRSLAALAIYRTADLLEGGAPALTFDLRPLGEVQGEGVDLDADGTVVLTSEGGDDGAPTLTILSCRVP